MFGVFCHLSPIHVPLLPLLRLVQSFAGQTKDLGVKM